MNDAKIKVELMERGVVKKERKEETKKIEQYEKWFEFDQLIYNYR